MQIIFWGDMMERAQQTGKWTVPIVILGWIFAIASLIAYPFIFGVLGVTMGILASKKGSRAGLPVIVASIILMTAGLIFSGVIMNYLTHYLGIS
jgi:hypothetical protein